MTDPKNTTSSLKESAISLGDLMPVLTQKKYIRQNPRQIDSDYFITIE